VLTNRLDTQLLREAHKFSDGLDAKLFHDGSSVGLNGALGRAQVKGDLFV
jgi:hypothetical protein